MPTPNTSPTATTAVLIAGIAEQTGWLRALALPQVRQTIEQMLTKTTMRKAYEASDGTATVREVARAAGASTGSIGGWWIPWCATGIGVETDDGRVRHLISLKGLSIPIDIKES